MAMPPLEIWYVLVYPGSDDCPPDREEVRRRGTRLLLRSDIVDWELKDKIRQDEKLCSPLLLYYVNEKSSWSMCINIDWSLNPWYIKVDILDPVEPDRLADVEERAERNQYILDRESRNPDRKPRPVMRFEVVYAMSMPGCKIHSSLGLYHNRTMRCIRFPEVPSVGEFKERLCAIGGHRVNKSWPVMCLNKESGKFELINLQGIKDDVPISTLGTSEVVELIFECPNNMFACEFPNGSMPYEPFRPVPPEEQYR